MVDFGIFLDKFERIANSKSELASESCYNMDKKDPNVYLGLAMEEFSWYTLKNNY